MSESAMRERAVPASISLRAPAAWLAQHSQYTPLDAASHKLLLPALCPADEAETRNKSPQTHPARTALKFRSSLFKGLQVEGSALVAIRRSRNTPAFNFGKKRAWEKPPFLKGAAFPIQNSIREADSSFL